MAVIDIRTAVQMDSVSKILLQIAENPLKFIGQAQSEAPLIPVPEILAAQLARQASASIVSNCVVELWSTTVCYLHALEPDFPLYPSSVIKFVEESRLPFLSYMSLYYSLCGEKFEGTSAQEKIKVLVDIRNELQHDKPETRNDYSTERVEKVLKWQRRLTSLVGKDALLWLPRVRYTAEKSFQIQGEPPIMKFMKYPVAKWAVDVTREVKREMRDMLYKYQGQRKLQAELTSEEIIDTIDNRINSSPEMWRLWVAGE